jgi:hypothetical protein
MVNLRRAHNDEFFQFLVDRSGLHHSAKVCDQSAKYLRTMGDRTKHVWHVSALFLVVVVDFLCCLIDLVSLKPLNAGHGTLQELNIED